ncbi:hypothetical protein [Anatilimnocola floriformis]|uniref:hypothetical protein n=1 Tax=Anatilimnocola floriformis TaxID=2948575 RepID=UPI0020C53F32|nr:hypothetical protein [Anatilimnocola floriformis]
MESFTLTCTTCKSRLKVRDTGVVGQIMACPKCGGMVLIKPDPQVAPGQSSAPQNARSNETGETKPDLSNSLRSLPPIDTAAPLKADAFDDVDVLLGDVPARSMVPTPTVRPGAGPAGHAHAAPLPPPKGSTPATTQSFIRPADQNKSPDSQAATLSQNDIPTATNSQQAPAAKSVVKINSAAPTAANTKQPEPQRVAAAAMVAATLPQPAVTAATVPTPAAAESPPVSAGSPWQYWAMVSASGLLGVLLAVGVVAFTISWFSNGSEPLPAPLAQNTTPEKPAAPEVPASPENPAAPVGPVAIVPANPDKPIDPVVPPPMPTDPAPVPVQPVPAPPMPSTERDPLGITDPAKPAPEKPTPEKPGLAANDPFNKFGDILNGGPADPVPPPAKPAAAPPVIPPPEEEPNQSPTAAKLPKPQPRHIDIAARLAESLPAIEAQNSPLIDFLQVMQEMSTVPITLRPDGLAMVRITPFTADTPVNWKGASTTVIEAIQGGLQPLGLEAKVEADQLIVDVANSQLVTTKLPVKDLTDSDERRANDLAAALMTFVAPDSWSDEDNQPSLVATKDELTIRQTRPALAECVVLIEKLRVARGLRPLTKFDARLFELATRNERAAAALATPLTLNYSIPTPLTRVTDRLGKEAKVRILFDWQSLSAAGWNPDAEVTLTIEKQTLAAALNDLTQRMDLTWRAVDAKTIQILSPQTQADRTELELYAVGDVAKDTTAGAALVAKIRNTLGGQAFRDAGGRGEVRFDATGKCLIVALTQPQQQQVATLLKTLRAGAPAGK